MSEQQWKLVPVEPTDEMRKAYEQCSVAPMSALSRNGYAAAIAAAPQPPALGAELKPLAYIAFAGNGNIRCWSRELGGRTLAALKEDGQHIVELVDSAHVVRLLHERAKMDLALVAAAGERDQLKAEVEQERRRADVAANDANEAEARTADLEGLLLEAVDEMDDFITSGLSKRIRAKLAEGAKS